MATYFLSVAPSQRGVRCPTEREVAAKIKNIQLTNILRIDLTPACEAAEAGMRALAHHFLRSTHT